MKALSLRSPTGDLETVLRNAGAAFAGVLVGTGLRYLTQVVVARNLGTIEYGRFALGLAVIAVAGVLAEMGLPQGLVRFVAVDLGLEDARRVKGTILLSVKVALASGMGLGLLVASTSGWLARGLFQDPAMKVVLVLLAVSIPLAAPTTMLVHIFQGFQKLKYKVLVKEVLDPLLRTVLVVALLMLGGQLVSVVIAHLVSSFLCLVFAIFFLARIFRPAFSPDVKPVYDTVRLLRFSWPMFFVGLMGNVFFVTDSFILGSIRGPSDVGLYTAAQKTASFCSAFYASFISILGPIGADYHNRRQTDELGELLKTVSEWSFTVTLPVTLAFVALAPSFMSLFGSGFQTAGTAFIILSAGWAPHALLGTTGTILVMSGGARLHFVNFLGLSVFNVAANLVLVPMFGIVGAAAATTVSMFVLDLVTTLEVMAIVGVNPFRRELLKPLAAGAVAIGPILLFARAGGGAYPLAVAGAASAALFAMYFGCLALLGRREDEKMLFRTIWQRRGLPRGS